MDVNERDCLIVARGARKLKGLLGNSESWSWWLACLCLADRRELELPQLSPHFLTPNRFDDVMLCSKPLLVIQPPLLSTLSQL